MEDKLITYDRLMQAKYVDVIRLAKSLNLPIEGTHQEICIRILDANRRIFSEKEKQDMIAFWEELDNNLNGKP